MKNLPRQICIMTFLVTMYVGLLCGCKPAEIADSVANTVTEAIPKSSSRLAECEGEWTGVAEIGDEYTNILEDIGMVYTLSIYKEDGAYRADYIYGGGDGYSVEIYGKKPETIEGALYDSCENQEWYAKLFEKGTDSYKTEYFFTLSNADTMEVLTSVTYEDDESTYNTYTYRTVFKKADSDIDAAIYELRYPETITVSNVKELYNSLGSNRKIILKEGTYNFSELSEDDKDVDNKSVNWRYYTGDTDDYDIHYFPEAQAYCYGIDNLILEGEEGADVHICTADPLLAPIAFSNSRHITLKNLRVGHMVEPGFCSGSVTYFTGCSYVDIEGCKLYGSGTYGVEAEYSYKFNIQDSDIYECTYGLMRLSDCSEMIIADSILRDSIEFSMFTLTGSSNIEFKNCTISGNDSSQWGEAFIDANDTYGDIKFNDCTFTNNKYKKISSGEVKFNNCNIEESK